MRDGGGAGRNPQLAVDVGHVAVDGVLAQDEGGGDLLVAHALRDELQNLEFPLGETGRRRRRAALQPLLQLRQPLQRGAGFQRAADLTRLLQSRAGLCPTTPDGQEPAFRDQGERPFVGGFARLRQGQRLLDLLRCLQETSGVGSQLPEEAMGGQQRQGLTGLSGELEGCFGVLACGPLVSLLAEVAGPQKPAF